jgi:LacI family transcriptional regulator
MNVTKRAEAKSRNVAIETESAKKRVTVNDVARRAGVSVGTVSNVLNGRTSVSEERRVEVFNAIKELGFTQNLLAKSMRSQRSRVIGLCMPFATYSNYYSLVDALEERVSEANYQLMQVLSRQDSDKEFSRVQQLVAYKVDGVLLVPSLRPKLVLDQLAASGAPTVIVNRPVAEERRFDQVSVDHRAAMRAVTRELVARRYRSVILAVQYPTLSVTRQRIAGMIEASKEAKRRLTTDVLECGTGRATFLSRLETALKAVPRPATIVASNSGIASWTISAFQKLGVRYPDEVSLLALDDPEWAEIVSPALSVLRQPTLEISQTAWDLLTARMDGDRSPPRLITLDAELIFRDSVSSH